MIIDDTIFEQLDWQRHDNNKSYSIASKKYNEILSYVFHGWDSINTRGEKDGIKIKAWYEGDRCFRGINLNFWDTYENRTCFRCIEFKGTAKDFKAKVLKKFELLKSLKQVADTQTVVRKNREIAAELEITRLTQIAKEAFSKYKVTISKNKSGYRLTLEIDFNGKRELLDFCDKEE